MDPLTTVLEEVYVLVDTFVQSRPRPRRRGPAPGLSISELLTLALLGQLERFRSERAFVRYAHAVLKPAFPKLPERSQFNRQVRWLAPELVALGQWLAETLGAREAPYEVIDTTALPLRTAKRRGRGHLPEVARVGYSLRLGWFCGCKLLLAVTPDGLVTGFGLSSGNEQDHDCADTFFALRAAPGSAHPAVPSVGQPITGWYLADRGFFGKDAQARWRDRDGARVVTPPTSQSKRAATWTAADERWHQRKRQIVETVFQRLHHGFRLERDRPHTRTGLLSRVAAKVAIHHLLIALNRAAGRPALATVGVLDW